ncbi:hypothetical protein P691DRAFT_667934, partial [Macrolepiota fuliginosa MF-IS2]
LLCSIELVVDAMKTVKREEEDHRTLSALLGRFRGSRSMTYLADRKRALLWHGSVVLRRMAMINEDRQQTSGEQRDTSRIRRLSRAITAWDAREAKDTCHDGSQDSISSYGSTSSYPNSSDDPLNDFPNPPTLPIAGYAVVLSDLVLIGECVSGTSGYYNLIDDLGLVRIFSTEDYGEETSILEYNIVTNTVGAATATLEVIPVDSAESNLGEMTPRIERLHISLLDLALGASTSSDLNRDWLSALRYSANYTIQIWCRPWKAHKGGDDTAQVLASLVGSGLPLPRSPSGLIPHSNSREGGASIQEREERGWWSICFHQVMNAKRQIAPRIG